MIKVTELTKQYTAGRLAVDHLNFTVEKGHIYGLLGQNGAGKSSTLNMLVGALAPTEGSVEICGHNLRTDPIAAKSNVGYLPDTLPLYPELTPTEYLSFVAEARGIARRDRSAAVRKALNAADLAGDGHRLISTLSKGYRQRVGIAEAIVGNPPILVLDEPTVGLDPKQIHEVRELIRKLGREHTILLSSHLLSEITEVCDRILILKDGRLVADDPLSDLLKKYPSGAILDLTVATSSDRAKHIVTGIPGIGKTDFAPAPEGCTIHITAEAPSGGTGDLRERIFFAFAAARIAILSMSMRQSTLEDIFLTLTGDFPENERTLSRKSSRIRKKSGDLPSDSEKKHPDPAKSKPASEKKSFSLFSTEESAEPSDDDDDDGDDYRPLFGSESRKKH